MAAIQIDGNNSFHTGWLARMCGLPRKCNGGEARKAGDIAAFEDGWDMCDDTAPEGRGLALDIMLYVGQTVAYWVDDDGNELDENGKRMVL